MLLLLLWCSLSGGAGAREGEAARGGGCQADGRLSVHEECGVTERDTEYAMKPCAAGYVAFRELTRHVCMYVCVCVRVVIIQMRSTR